MPIERWPGGKWGMRGWRQESDEYRHREGLLATYEVIFDWKIEVEKGTVVDRIVLTDTCHDAVRVGETVHVAPGDGTHIDLFSEAIKAKLKQSSLGRWRDIAVFDIWQGVVSNFNFKWPIMDEALYVRIIDYPRLTVWRRGVVEIIAWRGIGHFVGDTRGEISIGVWRERVDDEVNFIYVNPLSDVPNTEVSRLTAMGLERHNRANTFEGGLPGQSRW